MTKAIKLLEENLFDIGLDNNFLDLTAKDNQSKNKEGLYQTKKLLHNNKNSIKLIDNLKSEENICKLYFIGGSYKHI